MRPMVSWRGERRWRRRRWRLPGPTRRRRLLARCWRLWGGVNCDQTDLPDVNSLDAGVFDIWDPGLVTTRSAAARSLLGPSPGGSLVCALGVAPDGLSACP